MKDIREALEKYIHVAWSDEDIIELRPLPHEKGTREWIKAIELLDTERIERLIAENKAGANIYAGILPRERIGGGHAADVKGGRVVWVDYDHISPEEAITKADSKGCPPPSMVVNTGHGAHLFWKLDRYTAAEEFNIFLKRFATFIEADTASTDLSRILRLPGFQNTKDMAEEVYASIVYAADECIYSIDELKAIVPEDFYIKVEQPVKLPSKPIEWNDSILNVEVVRARKYVEEIEGSGTGGRNRQTYRVAAVLVTDFQLNDSEALTILAEWDLSRNDPPIQTDPKYKGKELERLIESARKYSKKEMGNKLKLEADVEDIQLPTVFSNSPKPEPEIKQVEKKKEKTLDKFLHPGGTLELICKFLDDGAYSVQPELSLGAALVFFGVVLGRIVCDEQNTRTNLYVIGTAPSGTGKDRALSGISEIAIACGLDRILGPAGFRSGSALLKTITKQPRCLSLIDEAGIFFKGIQAASRQSNHAIEIIKNMLELYSKSGSVFIPPAAAGYETKRIYQPCFGMYGCTVPESLYSGLSKEALTNGFLPRTLLIDGRDDPVELEPTIISVPNELIRNIDYWGRVSMQQQGPGNVSDIKHEICPEPLIYEHTVEVREYYKSMREELSAKGKQVGEPWATLWTRVVERGKRVALIHACSLRSGVVTLESAKYGIEFVQTVTEMMIKKLQDNLFENETERNHQRILKIIRASGKPILKRDITRKTQYLKKFERESIIESLLESEQINTVQVGKGIAFIAI